MPSKLKRVGFVGWRGMVGSVLLQRMRAEGDFALMDDARFFTTSQVGQPAPDIGRETPALLDAYDLAALAENAVIITCQGGDYTRAVHGDLRARGWDGYWIDAASALRMSPDATCILDPVNLPVIERGLKSGHKDFIGGNCTVSLMLMALDGLFNAGLIDWVTVMTYQAISGGGARQMRELLLQMHSIHDAAADLLADDATSILDIDARVTEAMRAQSLPTDEIGVPLAGSLLPWVDAELDDTAGVSREEWKGAAETSKILGRKVTVESICVRVGVLRCHSQAFTIKLNRKLPLAEVRTVIAGGNDWVKLVDNNRRDSLAQLTPAAVTGTLDIPVGRVREILDGASHCNSDGGDDGMMISAFTVGDQLLWGAAEPLRRMLNILARH